MALTAILFAGAPVLAVSAGDRSIWIAEIRGTIDPGSASFLSSTIRHAEAVGAQAVIVELDTPGGLVSSVREMAQAVDQAKVPVVVYVGPAGAAATSAGALLSFSSHLAAMAPGTNIGAAHPVDTAGKDVPGAMGEKVLNDTAAFARGLAEARGRNPQLAEAVVLKSRSLTAQEALKEKLIELIANDRADLIRLLDGREIQIHEGKRTLRTAGAPVTVAEMTWGQKLLHLIANPNIATILMTLGSLLVYVEVSNPGITIAGALGVVCLIAAFVAFQAIPISTGGLVLVSLGVALMFAEIFVTTKGALAFGGVISFILGMLWIVDPAQSDLKVSLTVLIPAAIGLGGGVLLLGYVAARSFRLSRETRAKMGGGDAQLGLEGYVGHVEVVEGGGKSGKALIRGETWEFRSDAAVSPGDEVTVDRTDGFLAHVKGKK